MQEKDETIEQAVPEESLYPNQHIVPVQIEHEMHNSFLSYSMSVIVSRALPDVRDGLKPVHRRILYTMFENGLKSNGDYRKCADTVGTVLGRYHPHGDASVYDAMVRLAQGFSMRYPLVDGHGNFGSIDGDPPAAYRYTEAKMSSLSEVMLENIDKDTVDFTNNYDDRLQEPVVLPANYPNLLVNGSTGIAVGMATNIPPHNMREVIDGVCALIDNPDATLDELMEYIKGPDFPTGGIIMGRSGIRAAYATGRGKITVRAKTEIEELKNGKFRIAVTEIPYQVNKAKLHESIADLVKDKRVDGITNVEDHSDRNGMYLAIDLRKDVSPQIILNQLYSYTQMQVSYGIIMLAIVDGQPKELTLKQYLEEYIRFQKEVVTRKVRFDLKKAEERAHILRGLHIALDYIDEVISILRSSKSIGEGKTRLMDRFDLDDIQATAIVQMQLGKLTNLERQKIEDELAGLELKIEDLKDILSSEARILAIVKDKAIEVRDKYADERRTEIAAVSGEVDIEDLIPKEMCILTMTRFGYIKRQPVETYNVQNRGGRGVSGMTRREEDIATEMFLINSHDYVLFFTNYGKVYRLKCYEVPEGSRTSKGINIANLLPIESDEKVTTMIRITGEEENKYLVMLTRNGHIKRTPLEEYRNVRKVGLRAINLREDDELGWVVLTDGSMDILIGTQKGAALRMHETQVRVIGRVAQGVTAMKLKKDDCIAGMCTVEEEKYILTVSETGYGRISRPSDYRAQSRGGKGLTNYRTERFGDVVSIKKITLEDDILLISNDGTIIRIEAESIRVTARPGKGVRVMKVDGTDKKIVAFVCVPHEEDAEEEETENGEELLPETAGDDGSAEN